MNKKSNELVPMRVDDLLIVELDDRFEMAVVAADTNWGCNEKECTQNLYCPKTA
jgi:hypothetical protein